MGLIGPPNHLCSIPLAGSTDDARDVLPKVLGPPDRRAESRGVGEVGMYTNATRLRQ
jgi:hypothetical protein